jgi:hypothetical protein
VQVPDAIAYFRQAHADTACPYCYCLPVDDTFTCPAADCPCYGMPTTSSAARDRAAMWRSGVRPWRTQ